MRAMAEWGPTVAEELRRDVPFRAQRIAAAAPSDKERILNEAVNALANAVTDQGLSVEEYDSILEVAQNDPEIREKIRQRIRPSAK